MKIGLVLEGGGMRGMYTAGVLDTMMENGIKVDGIVGVSAGALFGVNFLSGQKGRALRYNKTFNCEKDYMGIKPLLKEGNIFSTTFAYELVPEELDPFDDETYMNSGVPFYAVTTNVETGEAEYIKVDSIFKQMDVLRASGSMPCVSKIVEIGDKKYLDGGLADSIPYKWMYANGYDKIIVILTRDIAYRKKPSAPILAKFYEKKYPKLAEKMNNRHIMYNKQVRQLKKWEEAGRVLVVRPTEPIKLSRIERKAEKLQKVYDLGVKDAMDQIEKIKEYIL